MPKPKAKGEKEIKKPVSKKKDSKPVKKEAEVVEKVTKAKSPSFKNRPSSVKKDVAIKAQKEKEIDTSAPIEDTPSGSKEAKLKNIRKHIEIKRVSRKEQSKENEKLKKGKEGADKNSKKKTVSKSTSRGKERERSRSKSQKEEEEENEEEEQNLQKGTPKSTPTKSNKSTPSKPASSPSSKSSRTKKLKSSGKIPKQISFHKGSSKSTPKDHPIQQKRKKISAKQVKESSSNIESSSSIDLSAEQKKNVSSSSGKRRTEVAEIGPDTQRISQEVEAVIKRIEDKKKMKRGEKLLDKKRKRGESQALVDAHTAKDFDYILQKNPNVKAKPYINLEDLSKHHVISYSDILLSILEVGHNSESYLFPFSSKSKAFWSDILEYKILKKIFADFKAETLRKYWSELSKYDTEDATDLIKKNKSYLDQVPIKLGTIVTSVCKLLNGQIKNLKEYIDNIVIDVRRREIFEHEYKNPKTGETTKVKEVRTTYNTRKRYEPGNVKDFKGSQLNIISVKEVYHENSNLSDFQKVMKNIKKEDSVKFTYLNEKIQEEKTKLNTINEDDKFVFKAIDNVLEAISAEFKNYSPDFILETLKQNSMDIAKTYMCLKEPMKNRNVGFTALDDKVLLRKQGEEYKILEKEKGKEAIKEREEFLNN